MRRLLFLLALPLLADSNQGLNPITIGYFGLTAQSNGNSVSLNASATYLAFSFVAQQAKTLNTVTVYDSAVNGTLGSTDLVAALYSDSSGLPGSSIVSSNAVSATPTGAAVVTFTGFSQGLTAGTQYWIVLSNANGTPGTNYPTYLIGANSTGILPFMVGGTGSYGNVKYQSANSGSTWTTYEGNNINAQFGYSDSTYDGFVFSGLTASGISSYGQTEVGVKFSVPANAEYNVRCAAFMVKRVSTPGNMAFKLYNGTTLLGTTTATPYLNVSTGAEGWSRACFSSAIELTSSMTVRLTILDSTSSDTSSTAYATQQMYIPNVASMLALKPMDGTLSQTVTTNQGSSFTDTTTTIIPFALLLDTNGEFVNQGGGTTIISTHPIQ